MTDAIRYAVDPMSPLPKRWKDRLGNLRLITGPVEGWVMMRRPGGVPFVLHLSELLNAKQHRIHGPFEVIPPKPRKARNTTQEKT